MNFDTTTLITIVSGISNGGIEKLLATSESDMRQWFKENYNFVICQVSSLIKSFTSCFVYLTFSMLTLSFGISLISPHNA